MKYYSIRTLVVSLPEQSIAESIIVALPNNAIPVGIEVRPISMPEGLFLHHLISCDEEGNPLEEIVPFNIYEAAWNKLSQIYSERLEQDNLDLMEVVMKGVRLEM